MSTVLQVVTFSLDSMWLITTDCVPPGSLLTALVLFCSLCSTLQHIFKPPITPLGEGSSRSYERRVGVPTARCGNVSTNEKKHLSSRVPQSCTSC